MTTHELTKTQEEAAEAKEPTFKEETIKEPLIDLHITEDGKVSHFRVIKKFRPSSQKRSDITYHYEIFMNGRLIDDYYWNTHDDCLTDELGKGFDKILHARGKITSALMDIKHSNKRIEEAKKTLATYLPEALDTAKGQEQAQVI